MSKTDKGKIVVDGFVWTAAEIKAMYLERHRQANLLQDMERIKQTVTVLHYQKQELQRRVKSLEEKFHQQSIRLAEARHLAIMRRH